jgi:acyl-CoA synthetase (AMP-forming)/AMP-acid ligase II
MGKQKLAIIGVGEVPTGTYPDRSQWDIIYETSIQAVRDAGILKFGPIFAQGYGATETAGGAISLLREEDHILSGSRSNLLVSAGKASLCSEIRIVDENGLALPIHETGEIAVKGKHVMMGYWKNPELTEKALRGGYKCPNAIEFWESIPTTPVGKILRKDVKKKFWECHERSIG